MPIIILSWVGDDAEANDVSYKLRKDPQTDWWWCHVSVPSHPAPQRLTGPDYHGQRQEAQELAQIDAGKRTEIDTAREPQVRRVRA